MIKMKKPQVPAFMSRKGSSTAKPGKKPKKQRPRTTTGNGTVVQAATGTAGRWAVYVVAGLVALMALYGFLNSFKSDPPPQTVVADSAGVEQQQAGSFAQSYVGAWLSATKSDHKALDAYGTTQTTAITGDTPVEYKDLAVASVHKESDDMTSVVVSASVKTVEEDKSSKDKKKEIWTPYWYQVAVAGSGEALSVVGAPTPIASPGIKDAPQTNYNRRVSDQDMQNTIKDFLAAYVTGKGDVTRYVAPDKNITAISPSYWDSVTLKEANSAEEIKDVSSSDGQTADVLVTAVVTHDKTSKPAQYVLSMKVRDGRWEVTQINSAPALRN